MTINRLKLSAGQQRQSVKRHKLKN